MVFMWKPHRNHQDCHCLFQATIQASCGNHVVCIWRPCGFHMCKSYHFHVETTKVFIFRLISSHNLGKLWKPHIVSTSGNHVETIKVVISRVISSHNPGKPWKKPCGFHMETIKVIASRLISSHNPSMSWKQCHFYMETMWKQLCMK